MQLGCSFFNEYRKNKCNFVALKFLEMGVIIRQSIKGTIVNYIGIAIGFFTTFFILTNYLTAEEVGLTRVLVDAAFLFSGLAQLGTNSSMLRFYPYFKDEENKDHGIFFWSVMIPLVGFLLFLLCFFIFKTTIIDAFQDKSPLFVNYFYFIIPIAFFVLYTSVFETNSIILMRIAVPKFIREVVIRLLLLITYLLYGFDMISLDGLVVCFCVTYGIATILNIFYLFSLKRVSFKPDWKHITPALKRDFLFYTLFLLTSALAGNITPILNSFFISAKMGLVYTGIFAIANYIATVIEVPYRSLGSITQPQISIAVKDGDLQTANQLCKQVSLHQLLAGSAIFLIIWINIDVLFQILPNGEQYVQGKWVVFILAFSRLFNSSFTIGNTILGFSKYYYFSLVFTVLLTASAIALNVLLIPLWGMNGAALATLISYVFAFSLLLMYIKRKMGTSPFSMAQLKVLLLIAILYFINWICTFIVGFLPEITSLVGKITEAVIRSGVVVCVGCVLLYHFNISQEINGMVRNMRTKIGKKRGGRIG